MLSSLLLHPHHRLGKQGYRTEPKIGHDQEAVVIGDRYGQIIPEGVTFPGNIGRRYPYLRG